MVVRNSAIETGRLLHFSPEGFLLADFPNNLRGQVLSGFAAFLRQRAGVRAILWRR
jgi:hypothetical protein